MKEYHKGHETKIAKEKKYRLWFLLSIAGIGVIGGIIIGMITGQMVFKVIVVEVGESLEGTTFNIEVDLNETQLIEGFKESFIPIFNETIQEGLK